MGKGDPTARFTKQEPTLVVLAFVSAVCLLPTRGSGIPEASRTAKLKT